MSVLFIQFDGFSKRKGCFASCVILIDELNFSVADIFKISQSHDFVVCSEIKANYTDETKLKTVENEFKEAFLNVSKKGHGFLCSIDKSNQSMSSYRVPRFSESDFELIIKELGGIKIPESNIKTPDFLFENIALELKDLKVESLFDSGRQKSIARIFSNFSEYTINVDPSLDYGDATIKYHRLIANTIKNHFKTASTQIKTYKESNKIDGTGIIILNTGMYSLPYELFKSMVDDILTRETKTIEFALIFSQQMQTNGWDMYTSFFTDFIGVVPDNVQILKNRVVDLINEKMTDMVKINNSQLTIESLQPISFEINNKIYYWNPGQLTLPWESRKK